MKFLFKTQFSFSDNGNLNELWVLLLKALLILFCALFPLLLGFFKYYQTPADNEPLFTDCNESLQEHVNSALSFRFPTYEDFLRTTAKVDPTITSNENDLDEENCSSPSSPDPVLELLPQDDPENILSNGFPCTNDVRTEDSNTENDDRLDDPVDYESQRQNDFIKELQTEIMKAKSEFGLPTIPEESEYPIAMEEDSKPEKKGESFNRKGITKELHKFHKQYTEKMRKYDNLNHQKTYAKELKIMQSKGSVDSVISKGLCGCRPDKKADVKTGENREIEGELELAYVVQLWVSWEFIVWQYKKALEICGREGCGSCRFNEVAEKFEHFKVLIQRFLENEWFEEGSRVEYYGKSRLGRRQLLQVPLLKEDEAKDNKKTGRIDEDNEEEDGVKIDRLIEIMQESIKVFWQFIQADKLAHIPTLKCHNVEEQVQEQEEERSKILKQVLEDLQKKDRKLKKMIQRKTWRLRNCKDSSEGDDEDDEDYFLAMVDLKLVGRVVNMQRITRDQLDWCRHKLSCITFQTGKIIIKHSSFLFPSK